MTPRHKDAQLVLEREGFTIHAPKKRKGQKVTFNYFVARALRAVDPRFREDAKQLKQRLFDGSYFKVMPDAYRISVRDQLVEVVEVEGTGRVSSNRMAYYANLYWLLEYVEWELRLHLLDVRTNSRMPVDFWELERIEVSQ